MAVAHPTDPNLSLHSSASSWWLSDASPSCLVERIKAVELEVRALFANLVQKTVNVQSLDGVLVLSFSTDISLFLYRRRILRKHPSA